MADRDDTNSTYRTWNFHLGWVLFSFFRLVMLSWRVCMSKRGAQFLYGDTLSLSVTFDLGFHGDPAPHTHVEQPPAIESHDHSLH